MNYSEFIIPDTHPCMPGHFPGNPVVPGVVVLERVFAAVTAAGAGTVTGISRCKFVAPLRPGQPCVVRWQQLEHGVRFECSADAGIVARGVLRVGDG